MHEYTINMLKIVGSPRTVNIKGRAVAPAILFSPAMCESMLFWHAAALSLKVHGEVLMSVRVVADSDAISGARLVEVNDKFTLNPENPGIGLASSLLLLSEAGARIMAPARKHKDYDYVHAIFAFRDMVRREYRDGQELDADNLRLNTVFYDTISKPARGAVYRPEAHVVGVKR